MSSSEEKPPGFTVTDRRSFDETGEARPAEPAAAAVPDQAGAGAAPATGPATGPATASRAARLPPVDFPTFVLSLGSSALLNLGEGAEQSGGRTEKDLPLAKHTIDILSMLEEKTRGNLNPTEAQLLENLLFDLRLRYVSAVKSK